MDTQFWERQRYTRRSFVRGMGAAAGALTLAPAIAACRGSAKRGSASNAGSSGSAARPVKGGTLTSSTPADPGNLDYAGGGGTVGNAVIDNCVEPLLKVDTQGRPTALLATSWENPDDRTYVFKLRLSIKFQDGTDFNADAVEYGINRIKAGAGNSAFAYIDKIEKPDQGTVKLTLSAPYAPFLLSLAGIPGRIISPAIAEKYGKDKLKLDLTGQGTGPFNFVEWKTNDHLTLVRNENYWDKDAAGTPLPYLDKLIYRVIPDPSQALASLRSGEIDVLSLGMGLGPPAKDTPSVKADPSLSYRQGPGNNITTWRLNHAKEPFASRELRQALCYAIDRQAVAHNLFFDTAQPFDVIFAPAIWTYDPDYHPYLKRDVSKAKQLLAQASKPNGFAFTLLINGAQPAAELIKDQLKEAGIEMTIQPLDFPKVQALARAGDYQAVQFNGPGGVGGGLDPDSWVYPVFSTKGGINSSTHYNNPEVDKLLEQGRSTLDPAARKPLYQQAQKLIVDDAALCVLFISAEVALSSRKVQNVSLGPTTAVGHRRSGRRAEGPAGANAGRLQTRMRKSKCSQAATGLPRRGRPY